MCEYKCMYVCGVCVVMVVLSYFVCADAFASFNRTENLPLNL